MFPNPPGKLRIEPFSEGLRRRIWWGAGSDATARWAAKMGMNLMSSTLKNDETGEPLHVQQRKQIEAYREAWKEAGRDWEPRVSISRSIMPITTEEDEMYFGGTGEGRDQVGRIDGGLAVFGRSYADTPDKLVEQLADDEALQIADTSWSPSPTSWAWSTTHTCSNRWSRTWPRASVGADVAAPSRHRAGRASPASRCRPRRSPRGCRGRRSH